MKRAVARHAQVVALRALGLVPAERHLRRVHDGARLGRGLRRPRRMPRGLGGQLRRGECEPARAASTVARADARSRGEPSHRIAYRLRHIALAPPRGGTSPPTKAVPARRRARTPARRAVRAASGRSVVVAQAAHLGQREALAREEQEAEARRRAPPRSPAARPRRRARAGSRSDRPARAPARRRPGRGRCCRARTGTAGRASRRGRRARRCRRRVDVGGRERRVDAADLRRPRGEARGQRPGRGARAAQHGLALLHAARDGVQHRERLLPAREREVGAHACAGSCARRPRARPPRAARRSRRRRTRGSCSRSARARSRTAAAAA